MEIQAWTLAQEAALATRATLAVATVSRRLCAVARNFRNAVAAVLAQAAVVERVRSQNRRIVELERTKTMYLRLASHELRGPVAVARGYVDLLKSGDLGMLPERADLALSEISESLSEVDGLVAELVEVARMQEGRRLLRTELVDLRDPVREASERMFLPTETGHQIILRNPEEPVWVCMDRARIRSAARNLLENAIKYSPAGGEICCTISEEEGVASVAISDQGVGLEPGDPERLFGQFERGRRAETEAIPGLGLGLHLAREIARAHGGDLCASSDPGLGTTFVLSLPLSPPGHLSGQAGGGP